MCCCGDWSVFLMFPAQTWLHLNLTVYRENWAKSGVTPLTAISGEQSWEIFLENILFDIVFAAAWGGTTVTPTGLPGRPVRRPSRPPGTGVMREPSQIMLTTSSTAAELTRRWDFIRQSRQVFRHCQKRNLDSTRVPGDLRYASLLCNPHSPWSKTGAFYWPRYPEAWRGTASCSTPRGREYNYWTSPARYYRSSQHSLVGLHWTLAILQVQGLLPQLLPALQDEIPLEENGNNWNDCNSNICHFNSNNDLICFEIWLLLCIWLNI